MGNVLGKISFLNHELEDLEILASITLVLYLRKQDQSPGMTGLWWPRRFVNAITHLQGSMS